MTGAERSAAGTTRIPLRPEPRRRRLAWRALAERLFPPAPAARITGGRIAAGVAAVLAGALVSLARQGGVGALDTAYDEDARIFLADAAALSPLDSLTASYQGYYHLVPRLLAEIAVLFPAPAAAAVLAVLAALVTSLLALFVFVAARAHLPYWPLRLVAAAPVVTLPLAQDEIPNAVCNLHWPLLYATVWALLWVPARISGRVVAVVVVAATVTSDLLALAFLPLAAARLAARRDRHTVALAVALCGGLAVQFGGLVFNDNPRSLGEPKFDPVWALLQFALRPVPQSLVGQRFTGADPHAAGYLLWAAIGWLLVLAVVLVALRRRSAHQWLVALVLTAQAAALYAESVMASGLAAPRYAAAPALLILSALATLVHPRPRGPLDSTPGSDAPAAQSHAGTAEWRTAAPALALVTLVAVTAVVNLRVANPRAEGPSWGESIASARTVCAANPNATVEVPVVPASTGRTAALPCHYLVR